VKGGAPDRGQGVFDERKILFKVSRARYLSLENPRVNTATPASSIKPTPRVCVLLDLALNVAKLGEVAGGFSCPPALCIPSLYVATSLAPGWCICP